MHCEMCNVRRIVGGQSILDDPLEETQEEATPPEDPTVLDRRRNLSVILNNMVETWETVRPWPVIGNNDRVDLFEKTIQRSWDAVNDQSCPDLGSLRDKVMTLTRDGLISDTDSITTIYSTHESLENMALHWTQASNKTLQRAHRTYEVATLIKE